MIAIVEEVSNTLTEQGPACSRWINVSPTLAQDENGRVYAVVDWLRTNAMPVRSVDPGSGSSDLQPLKTILQGVRVVGLGEATHGTREFFQFKHRVIEFLVTKMNFKVLAIQTGYGSTADINNYVLGILTASAATAILSQVDTTNSSTTH
jgi:hypothetical protein